MAGRRSVALRGVVAVLVLLAVTVVMGLGVVAGGRAETADVVPSGPAPVDDDVAAAAARTLAAGTARFVATYQRGEGPAVRLEGVTSFVGPATEVRSVIDGDEAVALRRTSTGDVWVRLPGEERWSPMDVSGFASVSAVTGWGDFVRSLDAGADDVGLDPAGRVVEARRRSSEGDVLEVRFSDFGVGVPVDPPP